MHVNTSALIADSHRIILNIGPARLALQGLLSFNHYVLWHVLLGEPSPLAVTDIGKMMAAVGAGRIGHPPVRNT